MTRNPRNRSKGWYNDIPQHRLCGAGIPIKSHVKSKVQQFHDADTDEVPPKELYDINYDFISDYWNEASKIGKYDDVENKKLDNKAFDNMQNLIYLFWWSSKNDKWEWFDFNKTFDSLEDYFRNRMEFETEGVSEWAGEDWELFKNGKIDEDVYNKVNEHSLLTQQRKAYEVIKSYSSNIPLEKKIALFDKLIHIEHVRGNILFTTVTNTDALREDFERNYLQGGE